MNTLDIYFKLSDTAGSSQEDFNNLIDLFSDDAVVVANGGKKIIGIDDIKNFYKKFFTANVELKHIWKTEISDFDVKVQWGVVGKRRIDEEIFTLLGDDYATLDINSKIKELKVVVKSAIL